MRGYVSRLRAAKQFAWPRLSSAISREHILIASGAAHRVMIRLGDFSKRWLTTLDDFRNWLIRAA
jgi:hypothetical protein